MVMTAVNQRSIATSSNNPYGDFPKPNYNPIQTGKIQFRSFCQCQRDDHTVTFNVTEDNEEQSSPTIPRCEVSCYHYMSAVARACQYKNCLQGMILYRGSKVQYETEICSFRHPGRSITERTIWLKNLLRIANHLPDHYHKYENMYQEGAKMFSDRTSILTTIRILALIQHYSDVLNDAINGTDEPKKSYIATPMLDCTRDLRVAASFAMEKPHDPKQGVVRLLLIPPPGNVQRTPNDVYWGNCSYGTQVQRLGDTNMLLIDLTTILPASALRPLNQSGYMIVYEMDLIYFHQVWLEQDHLDDIMELKAAQSFVNENEPWDALKRCTMLDVCIPKDTTERLFFHKMSKKGYNAFPGLSEEHLYPNFDPMKEVMIEIGTSIYKNKINPTIVSAPHITTSEPPPGTKRRKSRNRKRHNSKKGQGVNVN